MDGFIFPRLDGGRLLDTSSVIGGRVNHNHQPISRIERRERKHGTRVLELLSIQKKKKGNADRTSKASSWLIRGLRVLLLYEVL